MAETILTTKPQSQTNLRALIIKIAPLIGAVIGIFIGGVLIAIAGGNPLGAYAELIRGSFGGKRAITETILRSAPLLMMGLGMSISFRARVWNIGGEGQFFMGALFGGFVGLTFPHLPAIVLVPLMLVAGVLGGAFWAFIPGILKIKRGMSEIITTLMLNYIALYLMEYMVRGPLQEPGGYLPESAMLSDSARLRGLFEFLPRVHLGVLIALLLIPLVYYLLWNTPLGFRLRAVGSRQSVARYAGIAVEKKVLIAIMASGALSGLAGLIEVAARHGRLKGFSLSSGFGFSAILVALLGRMHPIGVFFAAVFFAALNIGAESMHALYGLPITLADAIQAVIVLSVLAADALAQRKAA
jgi:general nucleoside transport system permease protein